MRKRDFLALVTFAISVAIPLGAGSLSSQILTVSETKTLDASPASTLHLETSRGAVSIEGWDQPRVEITVVKSTTGLFRAADAAQREAATRLLEHAQIKSDRKGDEILISTQVPRHNRGELQVQYFIKAPRRSKIVIDHGNGGIYVIGMAGDVQANLQQGQIVLTLPENTEYAIDARATLGEVYWESDGQGQRHHLFGHSFVGASVLGGASAATQAPMKAQPGQTVPITVTHSVDGVEQPPQQINVPVAPDPTRPQQSQHRLYLRVGFGDILITKAYTKHAS